MLEDEYETVEPQYAGVWRKTRKAGRIFSVLQAHVYSGRAFQHTFKKSTIKDKSTEKGLYIQCGK